MFLCVILKVNFYTYWTKTRETQCQHFLPTYVSDYFSQLTDSQNAQMVVRSAEPILSCIFKGIGQKVIGYPASTHCENGLGQRIDPEKERF